MPKFRFYEPSKSDPQGPLPAAFDHLTLQMYFCLADQRKLVAVCEEYLNGVSRERGLGDRWLPLGMVIVTLADYPKLYLKDFPEFGFMRQQELVFLVPTLRLSPFQLPQLDAFVPYCFVDKDWSLVAGREVLGYPKLLGTFTTTAAVAASPSQTGSDERVELRSPADGAGITVLANTIERFAKDAELVERPILQTIARPGAKAPAPDGEPVQPTWPFGPASLYDQGSPFIEEMSSCGPAAGGLSAAEMATVRKLWAKYAGTKQPIICLKQLRDPAQPLEACYHDLTSHEMLLARFHGGGPVSPVDLTMPAYASLNIAERLGLGDPAKPITPYRGQYYVADLTADNATIVAQRCDPGPTGGLAFPFGCPGAEKVLSDAINAQVEQWRASAEKIARLKYGPGDYVDDVREVVLRGLTLWGDLVRTCAAPRERDAAGDTQRHARALM